MDLYAIVVVLTAADAPSPVHGEAAIAMIIRS
jgi:hypothetical protein